MGKSYTCLRNVAKDTDTPLRRKDGGSGVRNVGVLEEGMESLHEDCFGIVISKVLKVSSR